MAIHQFVHPRKSRTMERINEVIRTQGGTSKEIAEIVGLSHRHVALYVGEMVNDGIVKRDKVRGISGVGPNTYRYRAPEHQPIIFRSIKEAAADNPRRDEKMLEAARRNIRIYRLRFRGKSYEEIGRIVGMSDTGVYKALRRMERDRTFRPRQVNFK
jgi:predicted transcriptional regulator